MHVLEHFLADARGRLDLGQHRPAVLEGVERPSPFEDRVDCRVIEQRVERTEQCHDGKYTNDQLSPRKTDADSKILPTQGVFFCFSGKSSSSCFVTEDSSMSTLSSFFESHVSAKNAWTT